MRYTPIKTSTKFTWVEWIQFFNICQSESIEVDSSESVGFGNKDARELGIIEKRIEQNNTTCNDLFFY